MNTKEGKNPPNPQARQQTPQAPSTKIASPTARIGSPSAKIAAPLDCGTYTGNFRNWQQFLKDYVGVDPGVLCKEYERIKETVPDLTAKAFEKYKTKNRNPHVPCWDWTRVALDPPARAYINASYVDGFSTKRRYIMAQGPLPETVVDFWEMIWQKNVCLIVQLGERIENGIERWAEYWPKEGSGVKDWMRGRLRIHMHRDEKFDLLLNSDQIMGTLILSKLVVSIPEQEPLRAVHVLQYADWPYLGIPTQLGALMGIIHQMKLCRKGLVISNKGTVGFGLDLNGPIVILGQVPSISWHPRPCGPIIGAKIADGLGRSGVLVALDIIHNCFKCRGQVEVEGVVRRLREQRAGAVQSPLQYVTIYAALLSDLHEQKPELELEQEKLWKKYKAHFGLV